MRGDRIIFARSSLAASSRGFSLLDLLMSIAVMAVLISILLPTLVRSHESAKRVRCASNIRQVGLALQMYTQDYRDRLPPVRAPLGVPQHRPGGDIADMHEWSNDTMRVRLDDGSLTGWEGLGSLVADSYLDHPGVFYCPSHHGSHPFAEYADEWVTGQGAIVSNYQYRTPQQSAFLPEIDPRTSLLADGLETRSDYNHREGNLFLRADMSVGWFEDAGGTLYQSLPEYMPAGGGGQFVPRAQPWDYFDSADGEF